MPTQMVEPAPAVSECAMHQFDTEGHQKMREKAKSETDNASKHPSHEYTESQQNLKTPGLPRTMETSGEV